MTLKTFQTLFSKKKEIFRTNINISYLVNKYPQFEKHSIFHQDLEKFLEDFWFHLHSDKKIPEELKKETKRKLKDLLYLEMLFYFYSKASGLYTFHTVDLSVIFQKHYDILTHIKNELYLKRCIRLFHSQYSDSYLEKELEWYLYDIPENLKLFGIEKIKKGNYEITINDAYIKIGKRIDLYQRILDSDHPYRHIPKSYNFPTETETLEISHKVGGENILIPFYFRKSLTKAVHSFPFTQHIEDTLSIKKHWSDLNNYLTNMSTVHQLTIENPNGNWSKRFDDTELQQITNHHGTVKLSSSFKLDDPSFILKELTNILGAVGAGKSTLVKLIIKSLLQGNKKILILESDVQKCITLSKDLKKVGIESAVFLGTSNLSSHEETFLELTMQKAHKEGKTIQQTLAENVKEMELLDDTMQLKLRIEKELTTSEIKKDDVLYPHLFYTKNHGKMANPEYLNAGFYKKYFQLINAPVWIGNYNSFISSKCPYQFDIFERSFFELGLLRSDLVIIDESDNAQLAFDDLFVEPLDLVADDGKKAAYNNFADALFKIKPMVQKSKNADAKIERYINNIGKLETVSINLYKTFFTHPVIQSEIANKNFSLYQLLAMFYESFFTSPYSSLHDDSAFKQLKDHLMDNTQTVDWMRDQIMNFKEHTSSVKKIEEKRRELIHDYLQEFLLNFNHISLNRKGIENMQGDRNDMAIRFEFILWFSKFDKLIRELYYGYSWFIDSVEFGEKSGFNKNFIKPKLSSLDTVIPNVLLNRSFSYRYNGTKGTKPHSLEMFYYNAMGRKVMSDLNTLYRSIENCSNPAMILLSGTSYTPDSAHYHLEHLPDYLLSNKNQKEMKIQAEYIPTFYSKNIPDAGQTNELISLAGKRDFGLKTQVIQEMLDYLLKRKEFEKALHELEQEFATLPLAERTVSKKRILAIATTSFENAQIVTNYLKHHSSYKVKMLWAPKSLCHGQKIVFDPIVHISKNHVESLYEEEIDIFVFIMNSIGRGYNILQSANSSKSLIGKLYFLNRPYPVPDQFEDLIRFVHSRYPFVKKRAMEQVSNYKRWNQIVGSSYKTFEDFSTKEMQWSKLEDEDKKIIASNMFVLIFQTIGRGLRGGTDLKVAFLDGAFSYKTGANSIPGSSVTPSDEQYDSILSSWETMFCNSTDPLIHALYGPFIKAIDGITLKK